ncbi:hypothetical protein MTR67_051436 [Solanum verrucosum]|uniref:Uncharacterized protein n=1 Tax=Solanum verrucosum TaxID=315347 RepID=A0AAF1A049_SOLVR|nr:hypothetical protein MTR67_051436 [Solanum verrucosum]
MESNSFDTAIDLAVPTIKLKRFPLLDHYKVHYRKQVQALFLLYKITAMNHIVTICFVVQSMLNSFQFL